MIWNQQIAVCIATTSIFYYSDMQILAYEKHLGGDFTERLSTYKYLGIWLDDRLSFKVHIGHFVKSRRLDWVFIIEIWTILILNVVDYGGICTLLTFHCLDSQLFLSVISTLLSLCTL